MSSPISSILELIENGGMVLPPLILLAATLFYALGERFFVLHRSGRQSMRDMFLTLTAGAKGPVATLDERSEQAYSVWHRAVQHAVFEVKKFGVQKKTGTMQGAATVHLRDRLDAAFFGMVSLSSRHRVLIRTLVGLAPLLGLLGTVHGMIETFSSMGEMSMHSQSGGIAGGVSEALLSTQVGLVIAVPGILLGRMLDKRERQFLAQLEELKDVACNSSRLKI